MLPYSYNNWGITLAEYKMLCQAIDQGIVTKRQADDARYGFIYGHETVSSFINRLDWSHRFDTDIVPLRDCIDQQEFERICLEVAEQFSELSNLRFFPMEFHFSFPSHSGKSQNGGSVYFDDNGRITGKNWKYRNYCNSNLPIFIGERISNRIRSSLYG